MLSLTSGSLVIRTTHHWSDELCLVVHAYQHAQLTQFAQKQMQKHSLHVAIVQVTIPGLVNQMLTEFHVMACTSIGSKKVLPRNTMVSLSCLAEFVAPQCAINVCVCVCVCFYEVKLCYLNPKNVFQVLNTDACIVYLGLLVARLTG